MNINKISEPLNSAFEGLRHNYNAYDIEIRRIYGDTETQIRIALGTDKGFIKAAKESAIEPYVYITGYETDEGYHTQYYTYLDIKNTTFYRLFDNAEEANKLIDKCKRK